KEHYFVYKKYPEGVRRYIYTTNVVENINSRIERKASYPQIGRHN
ncbi:transposase, partial [Thermodesulfobacterium sp.]